MKEPPRNQSIPVSPVRTALTILFLMAAAIIATTFVLSKMQAPADSPGTEIDPNLATTCQDACRGCVSKEYDARCVDRCRFSFKPYCD
jgi:hypothetical protein